LCPETNRVLANTAGIDQARNFQFRPGEGSRPGKIESITREAETNISDSLDPRLFFPLGHAIRSQPIDINQGHFLNERQVV
jgi:hypothetical protein